MTTFPLRRVIDWWTPPMPDATPATIESPTADTTDDLPRRSTAEPRRPYPTIEAQTDNDTPSWFDAGDPHPTLKHPPVVSDRTRAMFDLMASGKDKT